MSAQDVLNRAARVFALQSKADEARRRAAQANERAAQAHTRCEYEDAFVEADEWNAIAEAHDAERRALAAFTPAREGSLYCESGSVASSGTRLDCTCPICRG